MTCYAVVDALLDSWAIAPRLVYKYYFSARSVSLLGIVVQPSQADDSSELTLNIDSFLAVFIAPRGVKLKVSFPCRPVKALRTRDFVWLVRVA